MGKEKVQIVIILILALVLRLGGINQSFWLDEASQAQQSELSLKSIWSNRPGDFHPPLFYLLAHAWLQVDRSEIWLRTLPLLIALVGIYVMYLTAKEVLSQEKIKIGSWSVSPAVMAAFLLTVNPFHIYYSQEFRMYALLCSLGIWVMYLWTRRSKWLSLGLALMLYTHYGAVLLLFALWFYTLAFDTRQVKYLLTQTFLAVILYLPWIPQFLQQLHSGVNIDQYLPGWRSLLSVSPIRAVPLVMFKLVAGRISFVSRIAYLVYIGYVLLLVGVTTLMANQKRWFLGSWLFAPLLLSIIVSFVIPLTQPFRLIFMLPALVLIFTQAVMKFPRLMLLLVLYISITGIVMYASRPRLQREQWRQASQYLQSVVDDQSQVVVKFSGNLAPLDWYAPSLKVLAAVPQYPAEMTQVSRRLGALQSVNTIYLVNYLGELTDPYHQVDKFLAVDGFSKQSTQNFEGVGFIDIYRRQ